MSTLLRLFVLLPLCASALLQHRPLSLMPSPQPASKFGRVAPSVSMSDVSITNPTPDTAAGMGIRDWPQQLKKGTWQENSADGQTLTRYILDGTGVLEVETGDKPKTTTRLSPGTLVEVSCKSTLSWTADDEIIILTPGFEEGGVFVGVLVAMLLSFVALIAASS